MRVVSILIMIAAHLYPILQQFNRLNILFEEFKFKELISGIPFDTFRVGGITKSVSLASSDLSIVL